MQRFILAIEFLLNTNCHVSKLLHEPIFLENKYYEIEISRELLLLTTVSESFSFEISIGCAWLNQSSKSRSTGKITVRSFCF